MKPNNTKWIVLAVIGGIAGALFGPRLLGSLPGMMGLIVSLAVLVAIVGYLIYLLSGNKVGRNAPAAMLADARTLTPAPGMARIYVVRRGFMGGLAGMKVDIAGIASGQIRMDQFVMAEVPPGTYAIETAMARNGAKPSNTQGNVTVAADEALVLRAMLKVHATHAVTVQEILSTAEGRAEIRRAKMVQWTDRAGAGALPGRIPATVR